MALLRTRKSLKKAMDQAEGDEAYGYRIVYHAVAVPTRAIAENAGFDGALVTREVEAAKGATGFNALTGEYGDLYEAGVIDPTKVVRCALQTAVSVASILLSSDALITDIPKKEADAAGGGDIDGMDY